MRRNLTTTFVAIVLLAQGSLFAQTKNVPPGNNGYSPGYGTQNILGGQTIQISHAPYQVSMKVNGSHICGGTIISDRWILSAAHCIVFGGATAANTTIHAGSNDQTSSGGQIITASAVYAHPNYNSSTQENDVALIYLSQPLQFNYDVMPIEYANNCNTTVSDISTGNNVYVSGWGITCNSCGVSQYLQGLSMPIISNSNAMAINQAYNAGNTANISNNMLSFYNAGTGVGPGDSGGPSVIDKNGNKINVGASSWGYWPKDQLPTVYANVRNYATWIENTTGFSISETGLDLYTKDRPWDMGFEPSNVNALWESEDIWVRNQNDGLTNQVHQNPEYYTNPNLHNYIYVRVRNRGCVASTGTEKVKVYWAKAATALSWPNHWNGNLSVNGQSLGDYIGEFTLPAIQPGAAGIAVIEWDAPNPANYVGLGSNPLFWAEEPHHFCLLSRIEASNDPMTVPETTNLGGNVNNNNNIAWKNLTVVDLNPNNISPGGEIGKVKNGATVIVGSVDDVKTQYDFEFQMPEYYTGVSIFDEAEIIVKLDTPLWDIWEEGGSEGNGFIVLNKDEQLIQITKEFAHLKNIAIKPGKQFLMHISFNFLTDKVGEQNKFMYTITQKRTADDAIIGGELFEIYKSHRDLFFANAGEDVEVNKYEDIQLSAYDIGEQASYNWYDEDGTLIYEGMNFSLSPEITQKYKLEVIAELDGFKDYDEVMVTVRPFFLKEIYPNPTNSSSDFTVEYYIEGASSAYLMVVPLAGGSSNQYILNTASSETTIGISSYEAGQYAVVLICDGNIVDYKNVLIN